MYLENKMNGESPASQYLDTTVTKFLDQAADDIAVTKYLGTASTRFLETAQDDIAVTKYLNEQSEDGIAVTKYLNGPPEFQENDISVTKFME